jgi:hypothetical protein
MGPLQEICEKLPSLTDGVLLAVYHRVVQECLTRDSISAKYLSKYPLDMKSKGVQETSENKSFDRHRQIPGNNGSISSEERKQEKKALDKLLKRLHVPLCSDCDAKSADCAHGQMRGSQSCIDTRFRYDSKGNPP